MRACTTSFDRVDAASARGDVEADTVGVPVANVSPRRTLQLAAKAIIDPFDRAILDFFLIWEPFGGPPDDECIPQFGLTPRQLEQRVTSLVENGRRARYGPSDRAKLVRAAQIFAQRVSPG